MMEIFAVRGRAQVCIALTALIFVQGCGSTTNQQRARSVAMENGQSYEREFKFSAAAHAYTAAIRFSNTHLDRVKSKIALADVLLRSSREPFLEPSSVVTIKKHRRSAEKLYREAISTARKHSKDSAQLKRLQVIATNNLAALLIQAGEGVEAAQLLENSIELVSEQDVERYLFNYGVALEQGGPSEREEALQAFIRAGALERAVSLYEESASARSIGNTILLLETLQESGELQQMARIFEILFSEQTFCHARLSEKIAPIFIHYLERSDFLQLAFNRSWKTFDLSCEAKFAAIYSAYVDDLDFILGSGEAHERFPAWSGSMDETHVFSRLLKHAGDVQFRQENYFDALSRYTWAWAFDRSNREALVYLANVISIEPQEKYRQILEHVYAWLAEANPSYPTGKIYGSPP